MFRLDFERLTGPIILSKRRELDPKVPEPKDPKMF